MIATETDEDPDRNSVADGDRLAAEFERHRPLLHAIARRTLGSPADADDAVQEAWLRLARTGGEHVQDLRGWLTTVTARICLDALRRRSVRREQPLELTFGVRLFDDRGPSRSDPEGEAVLADSVGLALHVVMDALTPAERVSFVLHDLFEVPFDAVAAILGRSTPAVKMLASRARGRLRVGRPPQGADAAAREVVDAFFAAAGNGDLAGLLAVLAPDVELRTQRPDGTLVLRGANEVASSARIGARLRANARSHPVVVDGLPGVVLTVDGRPETVMAFSVTDGVITAIHGLTDPRRLSAVLPSWIG